MAPWGVHPFHRIRYLRLGPDPLVQRDLSTKLPSMDGGAVLAETFGSAPTFGGAISQVSSFGGACSTLTSSVAALPTSELEHDTFSFSTLDTPSAGCQPSPDETLSVTPHRTTISYPSYWRLARALDRLNAPIPKHPNTILGEGSNDVELPKTGKRSRRSADIQKPAPKRVKLPPSVASSSANERSHTVSLPLSNPGGGIDTHKPELPLRGVVAFVDAISRDGDDLSEHWGEILRKLGARVRRSLSVRYFRMLSHFRPGHENHFSGLHPRGVLSWPQSHCE